MSACWPSPSFTTNDAPAVSSFLPLSENAGGPVRIWIRRRLLLLSNLIEGHGGTQVEGENDEVNAHCCDGAHFGGKYSPPQVRCGRFGSGFVGDLPTLSRRYRHEAVATEKPRRGLTCVCRV